MGWQKLHEAQKEILYCKTEKKKPSETKWKTWLDRKDSCRKSSWPCSSIPYLPCLHYSTAVLQYFQTQNSKYLGFCLLKFSQITTASALGWNAKKSVGKYCSFSDIHISLRFTPHYTSDENLPLSCFLSSDTVEEFSASIKKKQAQQLRSYSTCPHHAKLAKGSPNKPSKKLVNYKHQKLHST